jgi:hypothetical protein
MRQGNQYCIEMMFGIMLLLLLSPARANVEKQRLRRHLVVEKSEKEGAQDSRGDKLAQEVAQSEDASSSEYSGTVDYEDLTSVSMTFDYTLRFNRAAISPNRLPECLSEATETVLFVSLECPLEQNGERNLVSDIVMVDQIDTGSRKLNIRQVPLFATQWIGNCPYLVECAVEDVLPLRKSSPCSLDMLLYMLQQPLTLTFYYE